MYFWLNKGVDGLRLDAAPHLFEDANFTSEVPYPGKPGTTWLDFNHTSTMHLPETMDLLRHWSDQVYQWGLKNGSTKLVIKFSFQRM